MDNMNTEQIISEIKKLRQENAELQGKISEYTRALEIIGDSLCESLSPTAWGYKPPKNS